jgi:hypothetical protein
MSPYLYRRLMREKLARLRQGAGAGHAPDVLRVYVARPDPGRALDRRIRGLEEVTL